MFRRVLNSIHHSLSASALVVNFFLLLRNQCNSIIAYHIVDSPNADKNGENVIVDILAKKCSVVIDVGANKGEWTEYFLKRNPAIKSFLIEPSVSAYNYLNDKFQFYKNIVIINEGAAEKEKEGFFFEEPDKGETSSLISAFSNNASEKRSIKLITIDSLRQNYKVERIDFLKIDAEGYDFAVIKGCSAFLSEKKIGFIQFEYNSPWAYAGSTLIDAINFLKGYDYETFLLRKDGLYKFRYERYGEFYRYSNFFALPVQSIPLIETIIKGTI